MLESDSQFVKCVRQYTTIALFVLHIYVCRYSFCFGAVDVCGLMVNDVLFDWKNNNDKFGFSFTSTFCFPSEYLHSFLSRFDMVCIIFNIVACAWLLLLFLFFTIFWLAKRLFDSLNIVNLISFPMIVNFLFVFSFFFVRFF